MVLNLICVKHRPQKIRLRGQMSRQEVTLGKQRDKPSYKFEKSRQQEAPEMLQIPVFSSFCEYNKPATKFWIMTDTSCTQLTCVGTP